MRFNGAKLLTDPYARAITGSLTVNDAIFGHDVISGDDTVRDHRDSAPFVPKSVVVRPIPRYAEVAGDDRPRIPWTRTVLYETHVRGHTMRHPAVPPELRGTFAGLAHPEVIADLVDLGITTVELQPVQHFIGETWLAERGLVNYWGYNPLAYFAPHAAYASAGTRGEQVTEFREMVRAFHRAGLEVVLDVVFNHTCEQGMYGPTLAYRGIDNQSYYRVYDGGRRYVDITGTNNTLDLREPAVIAMVTDSLRYWVEYLGVDGFRFDLAPVLARTGEHGGQDLDPNSPLLVAIGQDPVLSSVKLIAEPWDLGPNGFWQGGFPAPWAEWNALFRDEVRDFWRGNSRGLAELATRVSGSSDLFRQTWNSVNFVACHDGFTLADLVSYEKKHNEANQEGNADGTDDNRSANYGVEGPTDDPAINQLRARQVRNLLATTLLGIGTPMLLAGDERGRTQQGNNNAYCQDNEISWLDWDSSDLELRDFVKVLLRLRREHHRVFSRQHFLTGADVRWLHPHGRDMSIEDWHEPGLRTLGMMLRDRVSLLSWSNASSQPVQVRLPEEPGVYLPVLDTARTTGEPARTDRSPRAPGSEIQLLPRNLVVFTVAPEETGRHDRPSGRS